MQPRESTFDLLTIATERLGLAVDGRDIPGNLDAALRAILSAAESREAAPVAPAVAESVVVACLAAVDVAVEHFGQSPLPSTIDFGLRSAGSLAESLGQPLSSIPQYIRQLSLPAWVDGSHILLAEMDAATRWRRISERAAAAGVPGFAPAPHQFRDTEPARALPSGWKVIGR